MLLRIQLDVCSSTVAQAKNPQRTVTFGLNSLFHYITSHVIARMVGLTENENQPHLFWKEMLKHQRTMLFTNTFHLEPSSYHLLTLFFQFALFEFQVPLFLYQFPSSIRATKSFTWCSFLLSSPPSLTSQWTPNENQSFFPFLQLLFKKKLLYSVDAHRWKGCFGDATTFVL